MASSEREGQRRYELADFDPADGHLHTCGGVGKDGEPRRQPNGPCDCAAYLFCIAQDAVIAVAEVAQWSAVTAARHGHVGVVEFARRTLSGL